MPKPRPKPKPKTSTFPAIIQGISATGKLFKVGDKIQIINPLGQLVLATITAFYQDNSKQVWATFQPIKKDPDCPWNRGCLRQELLQSPEEA
jgi:hypothetical protein